MCLKFNFYREWGERILLVIKGAKQEGGETGRGETGRGEMECGEMGCPRLCMPGALLGVASNQQLSVTEEKRTRLPLNTYCSPVCPLFNTDLRERDGKSGPCQQQWMPSYGDPPETYA